MCLKSVEKKLLKLLYITRLRDSCLITFKKIQKQPPEVFYKKAVLWRLHNICRTDRETHVLESLFNSEYCEILKSTYFEEHLRTAASKNVFIKKIVKLFIRSFKCTLKNRLFRYQNQKQVKMFVFISWLVSHDVCIHIQ